MAPNRSHAGPVRNRTGSQPQMLGTHLADNPTGHTGYGSASATTSVPEIRSRQEDRNVRNPIPEK